MPECPLKKLLFEESIVSLKYFLKALTRSLPTPEVRFYGFPSVCRLLDRLQGFFFMAGVAGSILTFTFFCGAHESHKETHNDFLLFLPWLRLSYSNRGRPSH